MLIKPFNYLLILIYISCSNIPSYTYDIESLKNSKSACADKYNYEFNSITGKSYAISLDIFVSAEGKGAFDKKSLARDSDRLKQVITGWGKRSINSLLYYHLGVWIKKVQITYINDSKAKFGEKYGKNLNADFVFKGSTPLEIHSALGYNFISPANSWRAVMWKDGEASYAVLGGQGLKVSGHHGRNIFAHELGHNFNLKHGGTHGRQSVMNSAIHNDSINFDETQIKKARKKLENFLSYRYKCVKSVKTEKSKGRFIASGEACKLGEQDSENVKVRSVECSNSEVSSGKCQGFTNIEEEAPCKTDVEQSIKYYKDTGDFINHNVSFDTPANFGSLPNAARGMTIDKICGVISN